MSAVAAPITLLVRNIGALVTCDPRRSEAPGVVAGGAVAASGGSIVYAGAESGLPPPVPGSPTMEIDARGAAVIPGFVDAHTHAVFLGDRAQEYALRARGVSYEEIAERGGGIRATVRATAAGSVEELVAAAAPRLARMLAGGTTTVEIKSGYGVALEAEMRQLDAAGVLAADPDLPDVVATYLPLHAAPDGDRRAVLEEVVQVGLASAARRARFADAFCEAGAWSVEECRTLLAAARDHGLLPRLHADQRTRSGASRLAAEAGAASADHLEHASDGDLRGLAEAGVVGVLLPGAALVLGGPPPPGRRLLDAGAVAAVATDCNPGTCYSESMPLAVALAVATAGLTPAEALVAATAGGAAALRLADRGVLRPGARCDLAVLDTPQWIDVAYHLGAPVVRTAVVAGRVVAGEGAALAAGAPLMRG